MPSRSTFDKKLKNYLEDGFSQALPWFNAIMPASKMTLKMTPKTPSKMTPKSTKTPTPTETHRRSTKTYQRPIHRNLFRTDRRTRPQINVSLVGVLG
jgi:hypothetical protein